MNELNLATEAAGAVGNALHPAWALAAIFIVMCGICWIAWLIKFGVRDSRTKNGNTDGKTLTRIETKLDAYGNVLSDHNSRISHLEGRLGVPQGAGSTTK